MLRHKGFTMVELMIVIVIVAILASVGVPMLRGRIERAKFTEGMAGCSTIATALTAYCAENQDTDLDFSDLDLEDDLGFADEDLEGKYFEQDDYSFTGSYTASSGAIEFEIKGTPEKANAPSGSIVLTRGTDGTPVFSYTSGSGGGGGGGS